MTNIVTRQELETLLRRWQVGELTPRQVFDWANDRFATDHWDPEDQITNEVLAQLDTLDMNLTTAEDIPHFLRLLALPHDQIDLAVALQQTYSKSIDIRARQSALANDSLYAPFCRPAL
jgi:hypothetical protein